MEEGFDSKLFLTTCFRDKDFDEAYGMLSPSILSARNTIKEIFTFAVQNENANSDNKLKVVESTVIAERDFVAGVEPTVLVAEYVRRLC